MPSQLSIVQSNSFITTLPVEILYRILDKLNIKDILCSFRHVCSKFRAITDTYNRLTIEFSNHSSETHLPRWYRLISPENVEILILRNSYSTVESSNIDWLFSSNEIHRFTRLRFVYFDSINENYFRTIMRHLNTYSTIKSLRIYDRRILHDDTCVLLSMVISLPTIRKLNFDISSRIIDKISWSNHSTIGELHLKKCSYQQWCNILHHSPLLHTASIDDFHPDKIISSIVYPSLTSLRLNDIRFPINHLDILLLSYPSLVYLNLTANQNSSFDHLRRFCHWENFLREKLPLLKTFYFHISTRTSRYQDLTSVQSMISAFRSPFWLEEKCWYVQFHYVISGEGTRLILRSSMNVNMDYFPYFKDSFLSYSTSSIEDDDDAKMRSVWNARVNLLEVQEAMGFRQFKIPHRYLFDNVVQLALDIDCYEDWRRSSSLELLSKLIDLSQLKEVWFFLGFRESFCASYINILLEKAPNIRHCGIKNNGSLRSSIEKECAKICHQIEHLTIQSMDITAMQLVLEHVEHISTITFKCDWSSSTTWAKTINWLRERGKLFSVTADHRCIQIWPKKYTIESSEIYPIDHLFICY